MKRRRRSTQAGEFEDPLKDYTTPQFEDSMEQSLSEETVQALKTTPYSQVAPTTTVEETLRLMAQHDIASVLVTENDRLVGIFSERDVLNKVADRYDQLRNQPVRDIMTPNPVVVYETDSPAKAINLMAEGGFRHVPILDINDKVVGILGPRRITSYLRDHVLGE